MKEERNKIVSTTTAVHISASVVKWESQMSSERSTLYTEVKFRLVFVTSPSNRTILTSKKNFPQHNLVTILKALQPYTVQAFLITHTIIPVRG